MKYLFIGHGRLATHLSTYLCSAGHSVAIWSRRSTSNLDPLVHKADVIALSSRDSEITGLIEAYKLESYDKPLVHFSGSTHLSGAFGFHPLYSFGPQAYEIHDYKRIHFVGTHDEADFRKLFPKILNPYHQVPASKLAYYHSLCSIAGNFPQILWSQVATRMHQELNIPNEALSPYLQKVTENFVHLGDDALTGPLARGDRTTLIRHLDALNGHDLQQLYYAFIQLFQKNLPGSEYESRRIPRTEI